MKEELKVHELMSRAFAPMVQDGWRLAECPDSLRKGLGTFWKDECGMTAKELREGFSVFLSDAERTVAGLFRPGKDGPEWWAFHPKGDDGGGGWVIEGDLVARMPEPGDAGDAGENHEGSK